MVEINPEMTALGEQASGEALPVATPSAADLDGEHAPATENLANTEGADALVEDVSIDGMCGVY